MLGTLRMERGESDLAEADFNRAIDMSRTIGYRHGEAVYQMNLGILLALINKPSRCRLRVLRRRGCNLRRDGQRARPRPCSLECGLDDGTRSSATTPRAERDVDEAYVVYEQIGDIRGQAQCLVTLGSMQCQRSGAMRKGALLEESLRLAQEAADSWIASQTPEGVRPMRTRRRTASMRDLLTRLGLEDLCEQIGMGDLAVIDQGSEQQAPACLGAGADSSGRGCRGDGGLRPGIELAHLVPFSYGLALVRGWQSTREADRYLEMAYDQLLKVSRRPTQRADRELSPGCRARPPRGRRRLDPASSPTGRTTAGPERGADAVARWLLTSGSRSPGRSTSRPTTRSRIRWSAGGGVSSVCSARPPPKAGAPTVDDLAAALAASVATVRRDLAALRRSGEPALTRGTRHSPPR